MFLYIYKRFEINIVRFKRKKFSEIASSNFHVSFRTERTVISPKQQILQEITGEKRGLSSSKVFLKSPGRK